VYFLSAIIAIVAGMCIIVALSGIPGVWIIGIILIVAGLIYLVLAYRHKETVPEEREKPLIDVSRALGKISRRWRSIYFNASTLDLVCSSNEASHADNPNNAAASTNVVENPRK
jgi:multisubunit Na+/H+ antiporter MnhB subunit